jgi:hypothetical protein
MKARTLKKEFIEDIIKLYEKYNLSIAHEDTQGAFIITGYSEENVKWMRDAIVSGE